MLQLGLVFNLVVETGNFGEGEVEQEGFWGAGGPDERLDVLVDKENALFLATFAPNGQGAAEHEPFLELGRHGLLGCVEEVAHQEVLGGDWSAARGVVVDKGDWLLLALAAAWGVSEFFEEACESVGLGD